MRINKVSISNFKGFNSNDSKNILEFPKVKGKPLSIIIGDNGHGKSTVWEAISWAFFGKLLIQDRMEDAKSNNKDSWSLVTNKTPGFIDARKNKKNEFEIKVKVLFSLDEAEQKNIEYYLDKNDQSGNFAITRTSIIKFAIRKDENGKENPIWRLDEKYSDILNINQITKKGEVSLEIKEDIRQRIINYFAPSGIRKYYFFDAANDDITSISSDSGRVEKAVMQLSGINKANDVKEMISHYIGKVKTSDEDFNSKKSKVSKHISDLEERKSYIMPKIESYKGDLRNLIDDRDETYQKIKGKEYDADIDSQIKEIDAKSKEKKELIKSLEENLKKLFAEGLPLMLLKDSLKNLKNNVSVELDNNKWPDGLRLEDINNLERLLKEDDLVSESIDSLNINMKDAQSFLRKILNNLKKLLKQKNLLKMRGTEVAEIPRLLDDILSDVPERKNEIEKISISLSKKNQELDEDQIKKYELLEKMNLKEDEVGDIRKHQAEYKIIEAKIEKLKIEDTKRREELKFIQGQLTVQLKNRENLISKDAKNKAEIARLQAMQKLEKHLDDNIKSFKDENREEIQSNMNNFLDKIFGKEKVYDSIQINQEYKLISGGINLGSQSRGQKLSVALSFVLGLIKSSGSSPPLVIDAPVAHISGEKGLRLFEIYKNNCHQTLAFMMPEREFIKGSKEEKYIRDYSSSIHQILLNSDGIKIKKGYNF